MPTEAQQIVYGRFRARGVRLPERNGLCSDGCPTDCFWRSGKECRRYRGCTIAGKSATRFTRRVNVEKCWWLFLGRA